MKKLFIGLVLGIVLSLSASVFANPGLVGKVIQGTFPLIINGERAEKDVIVIDGTSYLPVRDAGEMFGYEVGFENNTVMLKTETEELSNQEAGENLSLYKGVELIRGEISQVERNKERLEMDQVRINDRIKIMENKEELTNAEQKSIEDDKERINEMNIEITELESQLSVLRPQLDVLQSETSGELSDKAKAIIIKAIVRNVEKAIETLKQRQLGNEYEDTIRQYEQRIDNLESQLEQL